MPLEGQPIHLTDAQPDDLEEIARSNGLPAGLVQCAKIVLLLPQGVSARAVETKLDVSRPAITKWRRRFVEHGVEGPTNRHRGRPPWKLTARVRVLVLAATQRPPPDGTTHWSCRRLAAHIGVIKDIVQRVWREADLRPHGPARYMASNDPDFETKAADIIERHGFEYKRPARCRTAQLGARRLGYTSSRRGRPAIPELPSSVRSSAER